MSKHTPGPWKFEDEHIWDQDGNIVADSYTMATKNTAPGEMEANARLIAAAPDLLAAGKAMLEALANCPGEFNYSVLIETELRTAIAKAENGSE